MSKTKYGLVFVALATILLGYLAKLPCAADGWSVSQANLIRLCYSDIGALYYWRGLIDGIIPYIEQGGDGYIEYPVMTGIIMWITSALTHALQGSSNGLTLFVFLTWLSSAAFMLAAVLVTRRIKSTNPSATWWLALSPAVFFTLGINWDSAAVLAMLVALWAWQQGRYELAGMAVGLGISAKLFPALLLVVFAIDSFKNQRIRDFIRTAYVSIGIWLVFNLPFAIVNFEGWSHFYTFSRERGIDFGSPYLALAYTEALGSPWTSTSVANAISAVAMVAAVVVIFWKRDSLDIFSMSLILVAVFCLFNKVYSPQYWLWLSPLVALCFNSLKTWIAWNAMQTVYFIAIWRFILHGDKSYLGGGAIDEPTYALAIILMWVTTAALVIAKFIKRDQPQPAHDLSHL
jgi:uncharacterized membrane protein